MRGQTVPRLIALVAAFFFLTGCAATQTSSQAESNDIVVQELVKTTHSWNGARLPAYPTGQPEVTILRITIPAGAKLKLHSHPVINAGVLVSGRLRVITADGKTLDLHAGDPIVEVVNTSHYGVNPGDEPAQIIVFYAGVVDTPVTVIEPH